MSSEIIDINMNNGDKKQTSKHKTNILITSICAGIGVIALAAFIAFFAVGNKSNANSEFEDIKRSFAEQGIEYTEQDYSNDKEIINSSINKQTGLVEIPEGDRSKLSSAYNKSLSKSEKSLKEVNEKTGVVQNTTEVQNVIIKEIESTLNFINSGYGWDYEQTKKYVKHLDDYVKTGNADTSLTVLGSMPLDEQVKMLRLSAFTKIPFSIYNDFPGVNEQVFEKWFKIGHPALGNVYSFSFADSMDKIGDTICQLKAYVSSSNGNFVIWCSVGEFEGKETYTVVDIDRQ